MRILALLTWLLLPIVALAYHLGPGQEHQTLDNVAGVLAQVQEHSAAKAWDLVIEDCDRALSQLPKERLAEARRLVLERAKARMLCRQLPVAHQELKGLLDDLQADSSADPKLLADARAALANAQYYVAWLMRLEGEPPAVWEIETEASRQSFRLLAEQATSASEAKLAEDHQEDLEAVIRLARMDLKDLQGLPLPCQCQGCKSCCNGRKPGTKPGTRPGEQQQKDARGASSGPPPDNRGS